MYNRERLKGRDSVNFLLALKDLPLVSESGLNNQRIFAADAKKSADIGDKVFDDHKT